MSDDQCSHIQWPSLTLVHAVKVVQGLFLLTFPVQPSTGTPTPAPRQGGPLSASWALVTSAQDGPE